MPSTNRAPCSRQICRRVDHPRRLIAAIAVVLGTVLVAGGCGGSKKPPQKITLAPRYQTLPPKKVPDYLKDTVIERCDLLNAQPFPVSGYGLVAGLHGTGDTFAATTVREYIRRQMITHGFGSSLGDFPRADPERVLKSPDFSIVRVDGFIPPGARKMQPFDVFISALDGNNTSSLAHGILYRTDLKIGGANPLAPGYTIDAWARGEGSIFVNPAYALSDPATDPQARPSLRQGVIIGGGLALMDRPLILRLRQPQLSMSRALEFRIDQAFQDTGVAAAKDEGVISLYMPQKYGTDWEHFAQVVMHLFLNPSPEFAVTKAKQLAEEAVKPGAPLLDISYAWEAMGKTAVPFFAPLMSDPHSDVAFAAARAAAFLNDSSAQTVLMNMARTKDHPFQVAAVQTLAKLPASPEINDMLRSLLSTDATLVRLEAYRALVAGNDSSIVTHEIRRSAGDINFFLDVVRCDGPPLIYASRTGVPRIALIGNTPRVNLPVLFMAVQNQLSISSEPSRPLLDVFYRGKELPEPVSFTSSPDLEEFVARLGGEGAPGTPRLKFSYCDVVSLLQAMSDGQHLSGVNGRGRVPVAFVLQETPQLQRSIEEEQAMPEQRQAASAAPAAAASASAAR